MTPALERAAARPTLVAITGTDGAGKTTTVRLVADMLNERQYHAQVVDRWDVVNPDTHPNCSFLGDSAAELRQCVTEMAAVPRALFLFWTFSSALRERRVSACDFLILDGYWMKHAAAELAYGCPAEWLQALADTLEPADRTYLLDIDPQLGRARKQSFKPYECGMDPAATGESFVKHQSRLRATLRAWSSQHGWTAIAASAQAQANARQIVDDLLTSRSGRA